jgi:hypothetical protein
VKSAGESDGRVSQWLDIMFVLNHPHRSKSLLCYISRQSETTAMLDGPRESESISGRVFRRYFPLIFILWILFVLYPNPANLIISFDRVLNFDADPGAVESILADLPSDPAAIEKAVLAKIPYRRDWELYGMPWYCPTVEQVLERGEGDCKARALVLASVLEAKNIPYQLNSSPMHTWVTYEGKQETLIENTQVEFYQYDPETQERQFQFPEIGLSDLMNSWRRQLWTPMPDDRKALLIAGLSILTAARVILRRKRAPRHDTMIEKGKPVSV